MGRNAAFRNRMYDFQGLEPSDRERLACLPCGKDYEGKSLMADVDAVTTAILKGRFEQIADEMDATLFRSAFNPIIAEAHDASHGIYEAGTGLTLVQGKSGLPIFVGVMAFGVKAVIEKAAKPARG